MPKRPIGYEGDWLCIGCLERRLDRMLSRADFKYPDSHNDGCDSDRLLNRLGKNRTADLIATIPADLSIPAFLDRRPLQELLQEAA